MPRRGRENVWYGPWEERRAYLRRMKEQHPADSLDAGRSVRDFLERWGWQRRDSRDKNRRRLDDAVVRLERCC